MTTTIETGKVQERRRLRFNSVDELRAEIDRIVAAERAGTLRRSGNWTAVTHPTAYTRFTPNNSEQRLHPPYYRGCWHGVSRCFLRWYRQVRMVLTSASFFPPDRALRPEGLHHPRGVAASRFPPLRKIPHCCLP